MEPVNYAIVLYMNDEKTAMVKEWIRELAPVCGSDYCLETEPPSGNGNTLTMRE